MIDSQQPELVTIPSGYSVLGDAWGDGDVDEQPATTLFVNSFRLGKHTVTNNQFLRFLNDQNGLGEAARSQFVDTESRSSQIRFDSKRFTCQEGFEEHPATYINWLGASAYCAWLSKNTGVRMHLPTEVQWQHAAMGAGKLKWGLGNTFDQKEYVCGHHASARVDIGSESDWGLFNMTGNVFEWCDDEYGFSFNDRGDRNLLSDNRVIKGGAFILRDSTNLRNAKRFSCHQESCISSIGFRVAAAL